MGNTISSSGENKSKLADKIDDIASKYILSQTFDDMNKMSACRFLNISPR